MPRDQEILDSAERLFFERSFDGVGVDDIGKAAGISGSAIYRHFSSKDEILAALFNHMLDALLSGVGAPDPDPQVELDTLMESFVQLATRNERLAAIWVREQQALASQYRREYDRRLRRYVTRWTDCLGRRYPKATSGELLTGVRAVQMLLLAEALRPPGTRTVPGAHKTLLGMARASLGALEG